MKSFTLEIDGRQVQAHDGMSLLDVARQEGIFIPTLCSDPRLEPAGACRMCLVEVTRGARRRLVASCAYPAEEGLVVRTSTPRIEKHRKLLLELLWPSTSELSARLGVTGSRFDGELPTCNLCGRCVRYCREVAKRDVLYFKGRGVDRRVAFVPGMAGECATCRQCFGLCYGGFVVTANGEAALVDD